MQCGDAGIFKKTAGVAELKQTPVVVEYKESLFSSLVNKTFEIKIIETSENYKLIYQMNKKSKLLISDDLIHFYQD